MQWNAETNLIFTELLAHPEEAQENSLDADVPVFEGLNAHNQCWVETMNNGFLCGLLSAEVRCWKLSHWEMEDKCYCVLIWLGMNKESIPLQITNVSITNGQCLIHTTHLHTRTAQTGLSLVSSWGLACYYSELCFTYSLTCSFTLSNKHHIICLLLDIRCKNQILSLHPFKSKITLIQIKGRYMSRQNIFHDWSFQSGLVIQRICLHSFLLLAICSVIICLVNFSVWYLTIGLCN